MLKHKRKLGQAPKKKRQIQKVDIDQDQFGGDEIQDINIDQVPQHETEQVIEMVDETIDAEKQKNKNISIVDQILNILPHQLNPINQIIPSKDNIQPVLKKDTETSNTKSKSKLKQKNQIKTPHTSVSSNWMAFLKSQPQKSKSIAKLQQSDYVCLDCQYVECKEGEEVARISIVNQNMKSLYESYIRPKSKIIDYRTDISGISYTHIKSAPLWEIQKPKVEKVLFKKILVGHTIQKDLEVLGMKGWFGFKDIIDVNQFSQFQQNGKVQGLRRLAFVFLEKNIQTGMHSSLQDAKITMQLFRLKKEKILQELKREKKQFERIQKKKNKALKLSS